MLEFELAGFGSRLAAALYDAVLVVFALTVITVVFAASGSFSAGLRGWVAAAVIFVEFLIVWGYFVLFEGLGGGRTLGKRRVGLRVVMDTGHPVTFGAAAVRNLLRLVDVQPFPTSAVGLLFIAFHPQGKRLGDLVAGTIVVRDRPQDLVPFASGSSEAPETVDLGPPALSDEEYRLLDELLARRESLAVDVWLRLATDLARQVGDRVPDRHPQAVTFLTELHASERAKRRLAVAPRRSAPDARAVGAGERFVSLKHGRWEAFHTRARTVERTGLAGLSGEDVRRFAADYREVAADLARARTYGVEPRVLEYLKRLVSVGHNALYGLRGVRRLPLGHLLLAEFPAAAFQARRYVLAAALLFVLPGIVGYVLVRERPEVAAEVIPDGMIARAEGGASHQAAGRGYAEAPDPYLPLVASGIIANNVQVAFGAFAFGITAGVGTVVLLLFNGIFFGAVLGLFANYGLAGWILTFVAGHGVLELTAIFLAGGAGLLIARALVAPGDLARRDALVLHGRTAIRVVGAAVCLLLLAGTIEGFLSASGAPAPYKFGVSAASAVLVALYFEAGRRAATRLAA